ncbi:aminomethyl-transferring glycine dehydrogenase [Myroides pelagicus]|uniref:glycine dehydrogenase (aminomethyl-transferring) n=1 Tax=Myroides pelagicus TaxID=270914 RepID=A0A7K1GIP4_9FLAO|nr:aminomethyl-transferring glycine dehydrogenase [Myroides pelagicus]MEC4113765.1 aminomethyl-transferring glycine dehydrogenase [Myroides pelagicus]MTH28777.1 aminomethyl-transferring glycine dehydrogenase [Myroides pelagicus]
MKTNAFALRHIGPRPEDLSDMFKTINVENIDQLINETFPETIRLKEDLKLAPAKTEYEYLTHIQELGNKNKVFRSFIGLGYNEAVVPAAIIRNVFENPGWYTAYTPYQAEVAQGRLEALLNYQTAIIELTGMEIANASLLDEATAASEAMLLLYDVRTRDQKKNNVLKFFVSEEILPQTLAVLETKAAPFDIEIVIGNHNDFDFSEDFYGALVQYPGKYGQVHDFTDFINVAKTKSIKVAVAADILSLVSLKAPGEMGADVVVGTTQRFGIPLGFGGPHAAYFATKEEYKRSLPGRIIGVSKDADDNYALRMALQTREQHIKRERATSNICTAQVLLAVMASFYTVYHGPKGLQAIANGVHAKTVTLANSLEKLGIEQTNSAYFDTIVVKADAEKVKAAALAKNINLNYIDTNTISISINETVELNDINTLVAVFAQAVGKDTFEVTTLDETTTKFPEKLKRTSKFLQHKVFNSYHSETELMRYIKKLERKDLALNHSMISLGSCTMKLNAAAEMLPLSNAQWNNIHPFAPLDQAQGYIEMLTNLENQLNVITGFAGTTLQPNSGAQGEYAGLMAIRAYHHSRGDFHRNIVLIPSSAHGTNPASGTMAGMKVVVTKTTEEGNIDVADLKAKAEQYKDNLSCLMVTYPSTHGVYESAIMEITQIIHDNGGQVYMDGANMNAQVAITNPASIGADVCHLNLHKTFAIPHGGGGPGVGPICVAEHLVEFLPSNGVVTVGGKNAIKGISAAPYGSALVCLISYGYISMLGTDGLKKVTQQAILNANYMKSRLEEHYSILYTGEKGRAAHEMIVDVREFKAKGIEVTDIAKRLIDYGFHAPTVSFPVAGTLMIEPTESESKEELDRFCDAMASIRQEIENATLENPINELKNAPHTLALLTADNWDLPYSRQKAAYPLPYVADNKFWPSVRRIDDAYGDRNLVCSCAPIEVYMEN